MKKYCLIFIGFFMQFTNAQNEPTTTIYLIRHAEKAENTADPDISEAGKKRALAYVEYFKDIPVDLVYSTPYKRTQQTCSPLAMSKQKEILFYKPSEMDLKALIEANKGKTILVTGHSNTIPKLVNKLLGADKYPDIEETEFGNLYVLKISGTTITDKLIRL